MSDTKRGDIGPTDIAPEQVKSVSGGDCTPQEWADLFANLKDSYETLIDFTSYVMERVAGK